MKTMKIELKGNGKIVTSRTEIYVSHNYEVIAFGLPMVGLDHYQNAMKKISQEGMLRPTTAQTYSLIDLVLQNDDEKHCRGILNKFRNNCLWTSTENLYTPHEIIVYDNIDGNMPSDRKSLIKRHKDGDKAVRIVPYGFKKGHQSVDEFLRNSYAIAQVGNKEMFDVVKRVAERVSKEKPCVLALNPSKKDVKKYTSLGSDLYGRGLNINGICSVDYYIINRVCCVSGVRVASCRRCEAAKNR